MRMNDTVMWDERQTSHVHEGTRPMMWCYSAYAYEFTPLALCHLVAGCYTLSTFGLSRSTCICQIQAVTRGTHNVIMIILTISVKAIYALYASLISKLWSACETTSSEHWHLISLHIWLPSNLGCRIYSFTEASACGGITKIIDAGSRFESLR